MAVQFIHSTRRIAVIAAMALLGTVDGSAQTAAVPVAQPYEYEETRALVALVDDATELVRTKGEAAFTDLRVAGSRWRQGESYIFVLDPGGKMLLHPDPTMEGKNQLELRDVAGKPIIRDLIRAATALPDKSDGWYHYQWPVPGAILPRWKSSYVRLVTAPSGSNYIVGSGVYNDRMERTFVVDAVREAVGHIEKDGMAAFSLFRDPTGPFIAKDAYVFVIDPDGVDLVNPAFPNLEGRNILNVKDTLGKPLIREMLQVAEAGGAGWVDYMWPRPGDNVSTQKSAYVSKAKVGDKWLLVGCGVYLADAPRARPTTTTMTAAELVALVRDGAAVLEKRGHDTYGDFSQKGSRWFHDDTYLFVWTMEGKRIFHAADPEIVGQDVTDLRDVLGRPFGRMFLETASSGAGEGWVHYMYPEPGSLFPTWKSTFVKRVMFPSGQPYLVGSGIYNMQMDEAFIKDVVERAAMLLAAKGPGAFAELRDKTGPFMFMDTYVFVDTADGIEVVNGAQPSMEGANLRGLTDVNGKKVADEYIAAAMRDGTAWVDYHWYRPGDDTPTRKRTYVRKVLFGKDTYIVGSGFYVNQGRGPS